jgi:hypothetical protein
MSDELAGPVATAGGGRPPAGFVAEAGYPACRDRRGRVVLVSGRLGDDGAVAWQRELPPACAGCDEAPEDIIEIVEQIVPARGERLNEPAG